MTRKKGGAERQYKPEEVAAALTAGKGLISVAARALGCTPQTVRNHIKRSALVREACQEAREATLDVAELALYNQVLAGEGWAVCFLLKTLGKARGYVERQELVGPDGSAVHRIVIEEVRHSERDSATVDAGAWNATLSLPPGPDANVGSH